MDVRHIFSGKRITVMGLGLLGRGVGDAKYLAEQGAVLTITDLKSEEALAPSLQELSVFPNITYVLGEHRLEDFRDCDFVLKAAGVPLDSPYIVEAHAHGIPVKMSASWFAELSGIPIVGVTGTRGKSTTTHMLHATMQEAGMPVLLGGNVRGVSTLALLDEATPNHYGLFELDSWQCQGFGDEKMSPHVAVFTTFMQDHMNYYHDDMEVYLRDKAHIFLYQNPEDTLVAGREVLQILDRNSLHTAGRIVEADMSDITDWKLKIPGTHNLHNAACARRAAQALNIDESSIKQSLLNFSGVPGRLELIGVVKGVSVYNDTTATTPDATIEALKTVAGIAGNDHKVVLIMGGADKGLGMDELLDLIPATADKVILLAGTGTDRITSVLSERTEHVESLKDAVDAAFAFANAGDIILLSPAFASFGMFKNEYDRGDQFNTLIASYGT